MASGFRIASAYVEVKADADGLRAEVTKDVKEAGAGQDIKVGVKIDNDRGLTMFDGLLKKVTSSAKDMVSSVARGAATVSAAGAAALTAAPAIASAVKWILDLGSASVQASPALLAIAAGGTLVKLTMDQIGPAIVKQLSPISDGFKQAGVHASDLAIKGVRPLAAEFDRLGMPIIASGMDKIAVATNGVVTRFLEWAKSTPGIQALRNVVDATGTSVEQLGPHISRFIESLGNMIGRIAGVSLAAGEQGLSGVLDKLAGWFDRVNAATVQGGLDKIKSDYEQVKGAISGAIEWIKKAVDFWEQHRTAISLAQDALAVFAVAVGAMTGNITAVVAGAVVLLVRHWDEIKAGWKGLGDYFTQNPAGVQAATALKSAWETVKPALLAFWDDLKAKVGPVVSEIWSKITGQLIPAIGDLINAVAPFVAAWLQAFGPTVVAVIQGLGQAVSGLVDVVTGAIKVVSGALSGDWNRAWEGAKQIASGAGQIIQGGWTATANNVIDTAGRLAGGVNANLNLIPKEITTAIKGDTGNILAAAANSKGAIASVPTGHSTNITAIDNASAVAQQVALRMSYIPRSVTTVITAIQRTVQGNAAGGIVGMASGGVLGMAPGGMLPMSGSFATIVPPNTLRVVGDRPFDDEAFIPINSSARSVGILAETARRMGFGLSRQGAGEGGDAQQAMRRRREWGPVTVNVTQVAGGAAETGRFVALALRTVG